MTHVPQLQAGEVWLVRLFPAVPNSFLRLESLVLVIVPMPSWTPRRPVWRSRLHHGSLDEWTPEDVLINLRELTRKRRIKPDWTHRMEHGVYVGDEKQYPLEWVQRVYGAEGGW